MPHLAILIISLLSSGILHYEQSVIDSSNSVVITRLRYNSYGMVGYGGSLVLRNTLTNQIYKSQSRIGFNPFVIIPNLPNGSYSIDELDVIAGRGRFKIQGKAYFNEIVINKASIYYLGNYFFEKIAPLLKLNIQASKQPSSDDEKIYNEIEKNSKNSINLKIIREINLFKSDSTIIK